MGSRPVFLVGRHDRLQARERQVGGERRLHERLPVRPSQRAHLPAERRRTDGKGMDHDEQRPRARVRRGPGELGRRVADADEAGAAGPRLQQVRLDVPGNERRQGGRRPRPRRLRLRLHPAPRRRLGRRRQDGALEQPWASVGERPAHGRTPRLVAPQVRDARKGRVLPLGPLRRNDRPSRPRRSRALPRTRNRDLPGGQGEHGEARRPRLRARGALRSRRRGAGRAEGRPALGGRAALGRPERRRGKAGGRRLVFPVGRRRRLHVRSGGQVLGGGRRLRSAPRVRRSPE